MEDRFKSQESRIQRLEQKLSDSVTEVQAQREETKKGFDKHQQDMNDMQQAFKSELIGLQKGITTTFQESLKQAMLQQTQEMKKLYMESPTGVSPPRKEPKSGQP